jgi:hypothetical protein
MTAKKKAAPKGELAETPAVESASSKSTAIGGLAELQAKADADAARGYKGPEKEN